MIDERDPVERARCERRLQRLQKQAAIGRARFTLRRLLLLLGVGVVAVSLNIAIRWWKHGGFAAYDGSSVAMLAAYIALIAALHVAFAWGSLQREIGKLQASLAQLDHRDSRRKALLRSRG